MVLSNNNFGNCLFLRKFFSSYPFLFFFSLLSYDTRLLESRGERAESIRGIVGDEEGTTPWGQTSPAGTPLEEHGRFSRGAALAFRSSNLMLPFACHVNIPKLYIESSFFFTATDVRSLRVSI